MGMSESIEVESEAIRAGAANFPECSEATPEDPLRRRSQSTVAKHAQPSFTEASSSQKKARENLTLNPFYMIF